MTTLLTGVNGGSYTNTCTGPAAGEFITAASVNNGLQGVLNGTKFIYDTKANLAGATFTGLVTCNAGLTIAASQVLTLGSASTASGTLDITATAASSAAAIDATGDGGAPGIIATGGASDGTGISATGGGTNGNAIAATGVGAGTGLVATGGASGEGISCSSPGGFALRVSTGNAVFSGTSPAKTANPGAAGALSPANICKAWGSFTTDGAGNVTNDDGYNIASVTLTGGTHAIVTFARAIAANYAPMTASGDGQSIPWADVPNATTTTIDVYFNNFAGVGLNPAITALRFVLHVFGR